MGKKYFPSHQKKFELSNKAIALTILFVPYNTEKIRLAIKSKYNFKSENQVILLIITNGKKWHYLTVKSLSALLREITSKHVGQFYCFHSYSTENRLKKLDKVCDVLDYCYIEMPEKDNKTIKYNHGEKSMKAPFIIYVDVECLLEKMHSYQIIVKNHQQPQKISIHRLVTHCLQIVRLIQQKTNLIVTEL